MNKDLHDIDQFFKNGIDGHQEPPPDQIWENISHHLDKGKVVSIEKKYSNLKRVSIALLIFSLSATIFALYMKYEKDESVIPKTVNPDHKKILATSNSIVINKTSARKGSSDEIGEGSTKAMSKFNKAKQATEIINNESKKVQRKKNEKSNDALKNSSVANQVINLKKSANIDIKPGVPGKKHKNSSFSSNLNSISTTIMAPVNDKLAVSGIIKNTTEQGPDFYSNANILQSGKRIVPLWEKQVSATKHGLQASKLSFTVFASPEATINNIKDDDHSPRRWNRDDIRRSESSTSSFSTGLLLGFAFNSHISLESGVVLSNSKTSITPKTIFAGPDNSGNIRYQMDCSAGYSYFTSKSGNNPQPGDSAMVSSSSSLLQYISVPLTVHYTIIKGKFRINPGAGLSASFLTKGNVEATLNSNTGNEFINSSSINGLKSVYMNGLVNVDLIYQFTKTVSAVLSPNSRFAISSINKNTAVKTYPSFFGLSGGVRINF